MAEKEEGTKEAVTALASIFAGLAEFFGMFDMSFFVAGAACIGALVYTVRGTPILNTEKASNVVGFIELLTVSYILGLLMFMIGRTVRSGWSDLRRKTARKGEYNEFKDRAEAYKLLPVQMPNVPEGVELNSMYSLGWAVLRQMPECQPSLRFINKYWVMAATFDGLAAASWVWMAAICYRTAKGLFTLGVPDLLAALTALFALSIGCLYRAKQYETHQERELAATLAIVLPRAPGPS